MNDGLKVPAIDPEREMRSALDEVVREGAQRMLMTALEAEVLDFVERHQHLVDGRGQRQVVRSGHLPEREIITGAGPPGGQAAQGPRPTRR